MQCYGTPGSALKTPLHWVRRSSPAFSSLGHQVTVVVAEWLRRWTRNVHCNGHNAAGPILSRGPVARRDRIVDSTLHCIAAKPGHSSLLQRDAGLLLATSSFRWILCLKFGGVLLATSSFRWILCLKFGGVLSSRTAAKRAGGPQPGVVVAVRLRRWTRNPLGLSRAGSNPADYGQGLPFCFSFLCR